MDIQNWPVRSLYGIEVRVRDRNDREIQRLWDRFRGEAIAEDTPERADDLWIAAFHSYEHDQTRPFTFFLGCEVIDVCCVPDGFFLREVPAGKYAVFPVEGGTLEALEETWRRIDQMDLRRTYALDFEIHDPDQDQAVSICVGVH